MKRVSVLLLIASFICTNAFGQLPTTELHWVFPMGGKAGTTFDVRTGGANQEEATRLLFSHPGITAQVKTAPVNEFLPEPLPQPGQFTVTIAPDVPAGLYNVWVVGRFGVSNVKTFAVSHSEELVDDGSNHSIQSARTIPVGSVVNGTVEGRQLDYYRVHLAAGQRVLVECWAQRIDSRANVTIVLFDSNGNELARDTETDGYDPLIDFQPKQEGDYFIGLYDFYYGGGNEYFYRLSVHQGPRVDFVLPLAGQQGAQGEFHIYGRNLPNGTADGRMAVRGTPLESIVITAAVPSEAPAGGLTFMLPPSAASVSLFPLSVANVNGVPPVPIGISPVPVVLEQEPNSDPQSAQELKLPCEVDGQFYPTGDMDWYSFEAKKGDTFLIDVISSRMGCPTDPFLFVEAAPPGPTPDEQASQSEQPGRRWGRRLALLQSSAQSLAQVDDPPERNNLIGRSLDYSSDDPTYRFVAPNDGRFRLMVRDNFNTGLADPRRVYRLQIRPESPDFRVYVCPEQVKTDNNQVRLASVVLRRGDITWLKVVVDRVEGFAGEVVVSAEGLPEGVTAREVIFGPSQSQAWLAFEAASESAAWVGPIRVIGRAQIQGQQISRVARPTSITWGTNNLQQDRPEFRLTSDLYLSVISDEAPATVQAGDNQVYETSLGGTLEIPIRVTRRATFQEALKLVALNIPNELKPGDVNIDANANEATLKFAATNNNAKPGTYTFYLRADSKCKLVRNPESVARVEQQQKLLEQTVSQLNEKVKATEANVQQSTANLKAAGEKVTAAEQAATTAQKTAQELAVAAQEAAKKLAEAKQAAAAQPDNKELADKAAAAEKEAQQAQTRSQEAERALAKAQETLATEQKNRAELEKNLQQVTEQLKQLQETVKRATEAKNAIDKQLADVKKANQPADVNIALLTAPVRVRIHPTPIELSAENTSPQIKRGEQLALPVTVTRKYGFAEPVELNAELPEKVNGIKIEKLSVPANEQKATANVVVASDATPGKHTLTLRAKGKFGNFNVEAALPITIEIVE